MTNKIFFMLCLLAVLSAYVSVQGCLTQNYQLTIFFLLISILIISILTIYLTFKRINNKKCKFTEEK
jgi:hypothetical protein